VSIPFVSTVRAAELRWWHGYLITYHSFNDLILLRGHYRNSFNYQISTVSWHMGKSAQDIYAMALTILQVGQPTIRLPPNPDFSSLSLEEKDQIYQDLYNQVYSLVPQRKSFAYKALSWGDTGPALESGLAIQKFVIAFVCRFQVILSHGFNNFPTINNLRQILLDKYERIGLEQGYQDTLTPDHQYRTVKGGSLCEPVLSHSWFSSIEVVGGRGSVHTIFGSISVRSAVLGSSWLVTSLPPTPAMSI
jgi:hypothetical protein